MLLPEHIGKPRLAVPDVLPADSTIRHDDAFVRVRALQQQLQFGRVRIRDIDDLEAKCNPAVLALRHAVAERQVTRDADLHARQRDVERAPRLARRCIRCGAAHGSGSNGERRA
jgi:hypothetical protein